MKPTYEELKAEVERLRAKLSPLEDRSFTRQLKPMINEVNLQPFISGKKYVVRPGDLFERLWGVPGTTHQLATLGRSLQAMGWVRSAMRGNLVFTMTVEEFDHVQESSAGIDL
jgi:hypothetical protein